MEKNKIKIKICGLTNVVDVEFAVNLKVDYLGFIFAESKRKISVEQYLNIKKNVDMKNIKTVGVFMNNSFDEIKKIDEQCDFDLIQLHGNENIKQYYTKFDKPLIKRIPDMSDIKKKSEYNNCFFLFDKTVLNNQKMNLIKINDFKINNKIFIAGGLNCKNIDYYIQNVKNIFGVDVSSGIEKYPGKKNFILMGKFVQMIKSL